MATYHVRVSTIERHLIARIAEAWNRTKDNAQPRSLECEIQFQLSCSYGKAAALANDIRLTWPVNA